jgi:hypothetical protein
VEAKLLQTAAILRTGFVLVISARALESLVPFLGIVELGANISNKVFRSWEAGVAEGVPFAKVSAQDRKETLA